MDASDKMLLISIIKILDLLAPTEEIDENTDSLGISTLDYELPNSVWFK